MVIVSDMRAKDFNETTMISPESVPAGELEITKAQRVLIKSGISKDSEKLVLELKSGDSAYSWFPNKTTIGALLDKFGADTDAWLHKKIKLGTENIMVQGKKKKMIVLA
jgi:hypothetical protein